MVRRQSFTYQNDQRDRRTMSEIDRENEDYIFEEEESKPSETDDFEPTGEEEEDDDDELEDDDDDELEEDDDDDDDFNPSLARRSTTPQQQQRGRGGRQRTSPRKSAGRASRQNNADSSSDDDDDDDDDEGEEEIEEEFFVDGVPVAPPTSRRKQQQRQQKAAAKPKKKSPPKYRDDDSSEEEEEGDDGDDNNDEDFEEEDAGDDDDDLEFDEDNEEEEEYRPRAKPRGRRPRGRPRKNANNTDSDDDDDDEDYNPRVSSSRKKTSTSKKKRQSSSKPASKKRGRPRKNPPKEESDSDFEEDEDVKPAAKRSKRGRPRKYKKNDSVSDENKHVKPAAKRKRGRPRKTKRIESDDDSDEEEFDLDEEDEEVIVAAASSHRGNSATAQRRRKPSRRNTKSSSEEIEISDDDDNNSGGGGGGGTRSSPRRRRFSAAQATRRLSQLNEDDSDNDSQEDDSKVGEDDGDDNVAAAQSAKKRGKKKRKELSSDEEFLADSTSEPSIEEAQFDSESDNEEDLDVEDDQDFKKQTKRKAVNIDNEEVGTAESSSDDDNDDDIKKRPSRGKEILPENSQILDSDDASSSDSESDRAFTGAKQPRMPQCPSTEDCITAEPLPKNHVCCVSPDGSSRDCFALETLRTIALKSCTLFKRVDLDGEERTTFLQPPHFRTKMSDDLLDQIASRFGRQALLLHGNFYTRKDLSRSDVSHNDDIFLPDVGMLDDEEELFGRVQRYMDSRMGTQDIYACPLCYCEMHRRMYKSYRIKPADETETDDDDDDNDNGKNRAPSENVYDPMLVLGWLDNEKFEGASVFCFKKVAELKQHLRNDHNVDTRNIDGNDLYMRFRVRAPDGLLQRYIKHCRRGIGNTFQGEMRMYWNEHSQSFIYLLDMMDRAKFYSHVLNDNEAEEDDREVAVNYFSTARNFFESFIDRAKEEWKATSAPFLKATKEDLNDFLVADGDVEEEEEEDEGETGAAAAPAFLAHREVDMKADDDDRSDQNDLIHKIERKYAGSNNRNNNESPSDAEMSDANSEGLPSVHSDEDDDVKEVYSDVSDINGYYSEVEDEKDDWVTSIQSKRKGKGVDADDAKTPTPTGKKLTKRRNSSQSTTTTHASAGSQVTPASKRRSIREDSDDE